MSTTHHIDAVARVYARSLFELALEAGGPEKVAEVAQELESICELTRADRSFREFIASPIIEPKRRAGALRRIFGNRVTDLTLRFLLVLNDKRRLSRIESINGAFDRLVQESLGRVEVDIFTAAPLGDDQMRFVRDRIREALGRDPVLHRYTDPTMIGGLRLRIGDRMIDGSVSSRLRRMKNQILSKGSARLRERFDQIVSEGGQS